MRAARKHDVSFLRALECPLQRGKGYHGKRGDHEGLVASPTPRVTASWAEPSASIAKICQRPLRFDWNARCRPLGAHVAPWLSPVPPVSRRGFEPSTFTIQRSCVAARAV